MKNVLVTGGAGFIGSHIVERLVAEGYNVRVVDNFSTGKISNLKSIQNKIEILHLDLSDFNSALLACEKMNYVIHHTAKCSVVNSIAHPSENQKDGEVVTLNLLEAAKRSKVFRFQFASSCSVYGNNNNLPIKEDELLNPISPYAASKAAGEMYLRTYANSCEMQTLAFRYFNVYGPRQDASSPYSGVISIFKDKLQKNEQPFIYGDGNQTRDFVSVFDVVEANILALQSNNSFKGWIGNIGSGTEISVNEVFNTISKEMYSNIKPIYKPARIGEVDRIVANTTAARFALRYYPQNTFAENIRKLINEN